ncbi:hypothetical protein [Chryseobacterium gregarium]|uniref:hypothetical protein n=1 Tax=Chryseobacterium gregarium TaxID=456299 RepID=UPI000400ACBF|nr:hypothetical protein [Chryseobacterium gregarium]
MLNRQKRNNYFVIFITFLCMQSCYAQNQQIKKFFDNKKKNAYQDCINDSEVNKIKNIGENKEIIELMINGCKDRGIIFDNFIDGTVSLQKSLLNEDDFIIYNWKKYDIHISAPTVTLLQTEKTNVVEFTYYDEVNNSDNIILERKLYEEKEGKFKNELLYIQAKLNGEKIDDSLARYSRNDYYIIRRIKGKYIFYTLINNRLEQFQ